MNDFNINAIANAIGSISTPSIPLETHFWLVRSNGGSFYDEFVQEGYVALGWNTIDHTTSFSKNSIDTLREELKELYDEKRPGNPINKCKRFMNEVQDGDYILIPNAGSSEFSICRAGAYYEIPEYDYVFEIEESKKIENGDLSVKCPYKKRRKIEILLKISAKRLGLKIIKATSSYHGISSLDEYAEDILNCVYNCYEYNGNIIYIINISKQTEIKAREFSRLMCSLTEMFCEIVTDEDNVSVKMSLSSPGRVVVRLKNGYQTLKKKAAPLLLMYFLLFGGSGFGFEFEGAIDKVIDTVKECRLMDIEVKKAQADLEGQQLDNYQKLVDLMATCNDSDLNINRIQEQMRIVNELNSTLQFENNEQFAFETESVQDESSEEQDDSSDENVETDKEEKKDKIREDSN